MYRVHVGLGEGPKSKALNLLLFLYPQPAPLHSVARDRRNFCIPQPEILSKPEAFREGLRVWGVGLSGCGATWSGLSVGGSKFSTVGFLGVEVQELECCGHKNFEGLDSKDLGFKRYGLSV